MNFFAQNKLVTLLLLCSACLFLADFLGAFNKHFNLLDKSSFDHLNIIQYGNVEGVYQHVDPDFLTSYCQMPGSRDIDFCGVAIHLTDSINTGINLSGYKSLDIKLSISTPTDLETPQIRMSLRQYSEKYAETNNEMSLKYNSLLIRPQSNEDGTARLFSLPLKYLYVDFWWVRDFEIPVEDAQVDLSNISFVEILHHDTPIKGDYTFEISKLSLTGKYLSFTQLLLINSIILFAVIFLLIARQAKTLIELSTKDTLTKVPNRRGLFNWIKALKPSQQNPVNITMYYIDIDDFKNTNDTYGHKTGDLLLKGFCERAQAMIKAFDSPKANIILTRMSGDEFVVACHDFDHSTTAYFADRLIASVQKPLSLNGAEIKVNISVGSASSQVTSTSLENLFKDSDHAMYQAKKSGKNQYKAYVTQ